MKSNPRCDHREDARRCPDSAGYRVRQLAPYGHSRFRAGRFCLRHAFPAVDRVPLHQLPPEDR